VTVMLGNINSVATNDYTILDAATVTTHDTPYDYYSLMHYGSRVSKG
jgi:hypothetical protein